MKRDTRRLASCIAAGLLAPSCSLGNEASEAPVARAADPQLGTTVRRRPERPSGIVLDGARDDVAAMLRGLEHQKSVTSAYAVDAWYAGRLSGARVSRARRALRVAQACPSDDAAISGNAAMPDAVALANSDRSAQAEQGRDPHSRRCATRISSARWSCRSYRSDAEDPLPSRAVAVDRRPRQLASFVRQFFDGACCSTGSELRVQQRRHRSALASFVERSGVVGGWRRLPDYSVSSRT
jgi:hypothetical protein